MGCSATFSPFTPDLLAVGTGQHFGIIGTGKQFVFRVGPGGELEPHAEFDTPDGIFDCCWSEMTGSHLLSACGDGSVRIVDLSAPPGPASVLRSYQEHKAEVYSVDWNLVHKHTFVTGSWDHSLKVWDPQLLHAISTLHEHQGCVYDAKWSPYNADVIASVSGDGTVKLWDAKLPQSTSTFRAHGNEVLSMDWNKYNPNVLATGSVDKSIRVWV